MELIRIMCSEITLLQLPPYYSGENELMIALLIN